MFHRSSALPGPDSLSRSQLLPVAEGGEVSLLQPPGVVLGSQLMAVLPSALRRCTKQGLLVTGVVLGLLAAAGPALACGERIATRGGQMNDDQGEMNFELVSRGRNFVVYLEDHGTPVATRGASAVVEVKRGGTGWTAKLKAEGENRFAATLPGSLMRGDSVAVNVSFPDGSIANGHFSYGIEPVLRRPSFSFAPGMARPGS